MNAAQAPRDNAVVIAISKTRRRNRSPRSVSEALIDMILEVSQSLAHGGRSVLGRGKSQTSGTDGKYSFTMIR